MRIISGKARGTKLYTLEGTNTRPTLDRIKESLFNILQQRIKNAIVLDLFSGSGALAIESLSRGAKKAILCDKSHEAINVIKNNIQKTHFENQVKIMCCDYKKCIKETKEKVDIVFIDPPYRFDIAAKAAEMIVNMDILTENGIMIIETDNEERELKQIKENIKVFDLRTYGRVKLIFLSREG